jgi:hypothetical protein
MTPELNIDPRALTPVDILHFLRYDAIANLTPIDTLDQYGKWVTPGCLRRLSSASDEFLKA